MSLVLRIFSEQNARESPREERFYFSQTNLRDVTGTPTLSLYDFFSFPICVVCFTLKWISLESCPTTFSLMYSVSSPAMLLLSRS